MSVFSRFTGVVGKLPTALVFGREYTIFGWRIGDRCAHYINIVKHLFCVYSIGFPSWENMTLPWEKIWKYDPHVGINPKNDPLVGIKSKNDPHVGINPKNDPLVGKTQKKRDEIFRVAWGLGYITGTSEYSTVMYAWYRMTDDRGWVILVDDRIIVWV